MDGRSHKSFSLRGAIAWTSIALVYALCLSFYKASLLKDAVGSSAASIQSKHSEVLNLFQGKFYFFFEDQFLPGIQKIQSDTSGLERIQILSSAGSLLFDTRNPLKPSADQSTAKPFAEKEVLAKLATGERSSFTRGFQIEILIPTGQYGVLYTMDQSKVRTQVLLALGLGLLVLIGVSWLYSKREWLRRVTRSSKRWTGLRFKFIFTIIAVNLITGAIVFFSVVTLQTREQSQRIEKESMLFSQFSTAQVISDFSNYFYFYYQDKFLPSVKTIISTNENLIGLKIISRRTGNVLFDSETGSDSASPVPTESLSKLGFSSDTEAELRNRDLISRFIDRGGDRVLSIINTFRNENQEALFYVEYLYSFHTLERSISAIRKQILLDLVPSLFVGLLIAVLFAQLLISPIRRLVAALQKVSLGDYDVSVTASTSDELGDLVTTFNAMAGELKKKQELRKYLSDSTYRQIMESPAPGNGVRLGGTRVAATILFSDIRNFVSHCESLEAEEVTAMLNEYFSAMVEVVHQNGGEVDKFIGDAILAVFYSKSPDQAQAPSAGSTAIQAIHCALEMKVRLSQFNQKRLSLNKNTLDIGVGITHGDIISGPIGAKDRMDFTVIGDVVNLASRIEKLSKQGQHTRIVFSNHVEEKVRGLMEYEELKQQVIIGKEEATAVFELIRIRDLDALLENLKSSDLPLRIRSVELLGKSHNPKAIPHVLALLHDSDEEIRLQAISAAGRLAPKNDTEVIDFLYQRLEGEQSHKILSALVSAIGTLCTDRRVLQLASFLDHSNERISANAVEAMGNSLLPEAIDLILPKLGSRNNRVKANAAMALFAAGHVEVVDTLKPMLMHSDALMRSSAAFSLGELTRLSQKEKLVEAWQTRPQDVKQFLAELQESVPMLVALLKDRDPAVRRQAVIALGKIKDKSTVLPLIDAIDLKNDSQDVIRDVSEALRSIGSHKLVREVISRLT